MHKALLVLLAMALAACGSSGDEPAAVSAATASGEAAVVVLRMAEASTPQDAAQVDGFIQVSTTIPVEGIQFEIVLPAGASYNQQIVTINAGQGVVTISNFEGGLLKVVAMGCGCRVMTVKIPMPLGAYSPEFSVINSKYVDDVSATTRPAEGVIVLEVIYE